MAAKSFDKLAENDITFSEEERLGGLSLLDDQLGYQVARYVFGREVELRRRSGDDAQVRAAITLLESSESPDAMMRLLGGP